MLERTGSIHALNIAPRQLEQGDRSKALFNLRSNSSLSSESAPSCFWSCFIQPFISLFRFLFCCWCYNKTEEIEEESEQETDPTEQKIEFHANPDEKDECPICLSQFTLPIEIRCGHVFDRQCYIAFTKKECPVCREDISNTTVIDRSDIMESTKKETSFKLIITNSLSKRMELLVYPSTTLEALKQIAYHHFFQKDSPLSDTSDLLLKYVFKHKDSYLAAEFIPDPDEERLPLSFYSLKNKDELTLILKTDSNGIVYSCDPCFVEKTKCTHFIKK